MNIEIPIGDVTDRVTLHVTVKGYEGWLMRLKISLLLIRLACLISGLGCRFDNEGISGEFHV